MIVMKYGYIFLLSVVIGGGALVLYSNFGKAAENRSEAVPVVNIRNFSLEEAPSESLRGKIATMSGAVGWLSRVAEEPVQLKGVRQIQQGEELETGKDGEVKVDFPGAGVARIFPESGVNFVQTLRGNMVFEQKSGSADYIKTGEETLGIRVLRLLIEVNGEARVAVDNDRGIVNVQVEKGSATGAYNDVENVSKVVRVGAGKSLVFRNDSREVEVE